MVEPEAGTWIPSVMLAVGDGRAQPLLRLPEADSVNKLADDVMSSEKGTRVSFVLLVKHPNVHADFCWSLT